jgi:dolichyl-phosphooligosaccharide-protein glycotransferase
MSAGSTPTPRPAWVWDLVALGLAGLGVALRCLPWRYVLAGGALVMPDTDPYYHLRRVSLLLEHGLDRSFHDAWLSFPGGAAIPWPPGFDLLVSLPGWLGAGPGAVSLWGAWLSPALGGLTIYLVFRLGRALLDTPTGLVAAGLVAFSLGAVHVSSLGRVDHHALVAPVVLGCLWACHASLRARTAARQAWLGCLCGLLAGCAAFSWIVTPALYFLPVPLLLVLGSLRRPAGWVPPAAAWSIAASSTGLTWLATWASADLATRPFALYQPSWLGLAPFLLFGVGILAARRGPRWLVLAGLASAGALGLVGWLVPEALAPLREAWRIAAGQDATYQLVRESDSVLLHAGLLNLRRAAGLYSYLLLLWPVCAAGLAVELARRPGNRPGRWLLLLFGVLGSALLMLQERFGEFGAPALALLLGWGLVSLARATRGLLAHAAHRLRARALALGLAVATLAALSPLARGPAFLLDYDPVEHQRELLRFGAALARALPGEPAAGSPGQGLLTGWTDAHPLLWLTGRAVTTSSFGTPEAIRGNQRSFRWLLSADEAAVTREMADLAVRHVVVSPALEQFEGMRELAGLPEPLVRPSLHQAGDEPYLRYDPLPPFAGCIHSRLWLADGSQATLAGLEFPGLSRFRLLLESGARTQLLGTQVATFKAFELVEGARLVGRAAPGEEVSLRLALVTNTGRELTYQRSTRADARGAWELVVPYATDAPGACHALGPYRVRIGEQVHRVEVGEQAVRAGARVEVPGAP